MQQSAFIGLRYDGRVKAGCRDPDAQAPDFLWAAINLRREARVADSPPLEGASARRDRFRHVPGMDSPAPGLLSAVRDHHCAARGADVQIPDLLSATRDWIGQPADPIGMAWARMGQPEIRLADMSLSVRTTVTGLRIGRNAYASSINGNGRTLTSGGSSAPGFIYTPTCFRKPR